MIISINTENVVDIIQHPFLINKKKSQQPNNKRNLLTLIKDIYKISIANVILNHERPNVFLLRSGIRQKYHSCHFCSILYWRLKPVRSGKEKKWVTQIGKWKVKLSVHTCDHLSRKSNGIYKKAARNNK